MSSRVIRCTIEFKKYFVIKPSTDFSKASKNYLLSQKESKEKVKDEFIYSSDNPHFLGISEKKS